MTFLWQQAFLAPIRSMITAPCDPCMGYIQQALLLLMKDKRQMK